MILGLLSVIGILWLGMAAAVEGAISMVVVPDGVGGTRYTFDEVSENPLVPVSVVLSNGFRMELPLGDVCGERAGLGWGE